ncbi:hypothetical protein [Actinomadura rugatobispora]|uniref:Uncharacterized protein n=1 Tax=Actinomadura rugatobispora TaxID=1994 RepID=A0ABW0ZZU2_9ACTN|nr:hypothetical protein GCM10010200_038450 [Actinomadura rugatobispora]
MKQKRHLDRCASWALLITAAALPLAGCGEDEPDTAAPRASTSAPSTPPPPAPTSAAPSASPAALKAADGTRLKSCADARCEVEIKAGDVIRFNATGESRAGFGDITVKKVSEKEITYDLASGAATFTQPARKVPDSGNLNGISLTLVAVQGERAVIRLGKPVSGAFSAEVGPGGMTVTTPGG